MKISSHMRIVHLSKVPLDCKSSIETTSGGSLQTRKLPLLKQLHHPIHNFTLDNSSIVDNLSKLNDDKLNQ